MAKRKLIILFVSLCLLVSSLPGQLKFSGYFSFEYLKSQPEGTYPRGSFDNLYGGLAVSGVIYGRLTFLAEGRLAAHEEFSLAQAYLAFQGSDLFSFKLGLFEVPFGRFNWSARPYENPTVLPPLVFHFYPYRWHDLGICLQGNYTVLYYSVYLINGLAADDSGYLKTTARDINKNKASGGRLGLRLGEGFEVGSSIYNGKYDSEGTKDVQFRGIDLLWVTPEWEVRGEYVRAIYDHPFLNKKIDFDGYYLTVSMIFKRFRIYFSYQRSDLPGSVIDDQQAPPLNIFLESMTKKTRKAAGFKWDMANNFYAKFEYDWNKESEINFKDNSLSVQIGFMF
ncbi:MAG: hypothetical protein ACPLRA_06980 [Candidatus Saccharicenans sp.]